ncbi:MAG: gluconokinase [Bacteroidales bacterium]|nr:gluconokinase [Bacteroidales bacterium]
MTKGEYIIGLDVGTSGVKALAFSTSGRLLGSSKAGYQVISGEPGRMEHDPAIIYKKVLQSLKKLMRNMGYPPFAIGMDTMMHSIMPVDEKIKPLGNLMLWNDYRSAEIAENLKNTIEGQAFYRQTGTPVHPMSWLTKINWLQENESGTFRKARYFIGIKEYLLYKLTGNLVLDYSTASSTGIFDITQKQWHNEALQWCGIETNRLPGLVGPEVILKTSSDDIEDGISIVPGLSDGCAANLGMSGISPSDLTMTLGTSGAVRFTSAEKKTDDEGILFSYCLDDLFFVNGGASNNCFNVIEKVTKDLGIDLKKIRKNALDPLWAREDGIFHLPWMFGERAPFQIYRSITGFVNQGDSHTPLHLLKSVVEGILFNLKLIAGKLKQLSDRNFECIHLSGGFSNFSGIKALSASIMNMPVLIHHSSEGSALGTAYFAAKQTGIEQGYENVSKWNPVVMEFQPEPQKSGRYEKLFEQFVNIIRNYIDNKV